MASYCQSSHVDYPENRDRICFCFREVYHAASFVVEAVDGCCVLWWFILGTFPSNGFLL
jgi:hypothetical protein